MKAINWPTDSFLDIVQFEGFKKRTEFILFSEKNLYPDAIGKGSSRHCLGNKLQAKGVGRNNLAHNLDYFHSWGGFVTRDCLLSIINEKIILKRTKIGCLKTRAVFKYKVDPIENTPCVIALRDSDCFRLSQITKDFISAKEREFFKKHLAGRFGSLTGDEIFQRVIDHYFHAFSCGIAHKSIARENLTLDGRFIDCESIEITKDSSSFPKYFEVGKKTNIDKNSHYKDSCAPFYKTWLHDLFLMAKLTADAYETIYQIEIDLLESFLICFNQYFADAPQWLETLDYESFGQKLYLTSNFPLEKRQFSENMINIIKDYRCIGSNLDLHNNLFKIHYSEAQYNTKSYTLGILKKLDFSLWNTEKTFAASFENYDNINKGLS
jgi:hypothetical protein